VCSCSPPVLRRKRNNSCDPADLEGVNDLKAEAIALFIRLCASESDAEGLARTRDCAAPAAIRGTSVIDCRADRGLLRLDIFFRLLFFLLFERDESTTLVLDLVLLALAASLFVEGVGVSSEAFALVPAAASRPAMD